MLQIHYLNLFSDDPFNAMPVESLVDSTLSDLPRLAKEGADIDAFLKAARDAAVLMGGAAAASEKQDAEGSKDISATGGNHPSIEASTAASPAWIKAEEAKLEHEMNQQARLSEFFHTNQLFSPHGNQQQKEHC